MSTWSTQWLATESSDGDGATFVVVHWYAPLDGDLVALLPGDDALVQTLDEAVAVRVAPVERRGAALQDHRFVRATAEAVPDDEAHRVIDALQAKYGWRRRVFRILFWSTRRLGGRTPHRHDVAIRFRLAVP